MDCDDVSTDKYQHRQDVWSDFMRYNDRHKEKLGVKSTNLEKKIWICPSSFKWLQLLSIVSKAVWMSKLTSAAAPSAESTLSQSSSTCLSQISTQYLIKSSIEKEFAAGVRVVQSIFLSWFYQHGNQGCNLCFASQSLALKPSDNLICMRACIVSR